MCKRIAQKEPFFYSLPLHDRLAGFWLPSRDPKIESILSNIASSLQTAPWPHLSPLSFPPFSLLIPIDNPVLILY